MKTYKYKFGHQSNTNRIGNLLDDMWQVHAYFHKWQRRRYKEGLPYANAAGNVRPLDGMQANDTPTLESVAEPSDSSGTETYS